MCVCSLYLTRYLDFTPNLDVVIIMVGVRGDPESPLFQSCEETIHLMRARFTFVLCTCFLLQVCDRLLEHTFPTRSVSACHIDAVSEM